MRRAIWDSIWGSVAILAIFTAVLFLVPVSSAKAADKGTPNIVDELTEPTAAKPRWTGPYIGAHLGYAKQSTELSGGFFGNGTFSESEVTYGVGAGFDVRVPNSMIVLGVMADMDFMNNDAVDWAAFAGGRAGVLVSPSALVYALAGYTWSEGDAETLDRGLTFGAGVEAFVFKNVSLKIEYRYVDLGNESLGTGGFFPTDVEGDVQSIRIGANYRF